MNNWKKIILNPNDTIQKAIKILDKEALQLILIANKDKKLIGTVSDGDIRRALIKNLDMDTKLSKIMFTEPTYCHKDISEEKLLNLMKSKEVLQIPIVNKDLKILGLKTINNLIGNKNIIPKKIDNPVLLMAGGFGKRLEPLTKKVPKPMIKITDKSLLEITLERLVDSGFFNFFISTHYKSEIITKYFGDGSKWGVNITYIKEKKPLGTAGSISLISKKLNKPLLVVNSDLVTKANFKDIIKFHSKKKSAATLCVRKYDFQLPYGVIETKNGNATKITEKPLQKFFVNAGIYILNHNVLKTLKVNKKIHMTDLLSNIIKNNMKVSIYPIYEYWIDVGKIENLKKAKKEME